MGCCGKSRERMKAAPSLRNAPPSPQANAVWPAGTVVFEYTGRTRLTVIGPITHTRYEFTGFGARLYVDQRDSVSVATVPALRRV